MLRWGEGNADSGLETLPIGRPERGTEAAVAGKAKSRIGSAGTRTRTERNALIEEDDGLIVALLSPGRLNLVT
jgi:hypothetical protein